MNSRKLSCLVLAFIFVFSLVFVSPVSAATEYKVSGKVTVNSATGAPLSGATVTIGGKTGITDLSGNYEIFAVPAGMQILVIEKEGYNSYSKTMTVSANVIHNAVLTANSYTVTATAGTGGTIAPQGNIVVAAGASQTFTISPNQGYQIDTLTVSDAVQASQTAEPEQSSAGVAVYVMTNIQSNKVIRATFKPIVLTLSGRAVTNTGTAVAGVAVTLSDGSATTIDPTGMTDANGNFVLKNIKSGAYTLQATKTGYTAVSMPLTLTANLSGVQILMSQSGYTVSGQVKTSAGAVLPGAIVTVAGKSATTDANGNYSISGIAAGTYTMTVSKSGYVTVTRSITITTANQTQNFALTPGYTVSGQVKTSTGAVLSGAAVAVAGKTATTDANGNYSISGIAAGTYTMTVSKTGYVTSTRSITITTANQTQNFALTPGYTVSGQVKTSAGALLPGATVTVAGKTATTNTSGNYSIGGIAAGTYMMTVSKTGYVTSTRSITITTVNQTQNFALTPINTATIMKNLPPGQIVAVADWTGKAIYANHAFVPTVRSESNDGLTSAPRQDIQFAVNVSATANRPLPRSLTASSKVNAPQLTPQIALDDKLRTKEVELLAKRLPGRKSLNPSLMKAAPVNITVGTPWTGIKIIITNPVTTINATCRYISNSAYIFVDDRDSLTSAQLAIYAQAWESINTKNRQYFGNPNINGAANATSGRIILLFTKAVANGYLGYFYSGDKYSKTQVPDSNEADMLYLTTGASSQDALLGTVAHEFEHMIYFDQHYNRGSTSFYKWLSEGLAGLAEYHNGYHVNHNAWMRSYLASPIGYTDSNGFHPLSLTYWTQYNYGLSGLYVHYLRDRFGDSAIRNLVQTDKVGIAAVEAVAGGTGSFNTVYQDFAKALVLSNTGYSNDPKYNFTSVNLQTLQSTEWRKGLVPYTFTIGAPPFSFSYYPYQLDFWKIIGGSASNVRVTGASTVGTAFGLPQ